MTVYNPEDYSILKYDRKKYNEYSHHELALFTQEAQRTFYEIHWNLFGHNQIKSNDEMIKQLEETMKKSREADMIIEHWKRLQEHLEENPTLKEEWEALLMAIKLTEDFD